MALMGRGFVTTLPSVVALVVALNTKNGESIYNTIKTEYNLYNRIV